jgi:hypothetical protein
MRLSFAENASIHNPALGVGGQQFLSPVSDDADAFSLNYLKVTIKRELQLRLSPKARIILEGEDEFAILDVRYTNYKRPGYIAAVQPAVAQDVVETV